VARPASESATASRIAPTPPSVDTVDVSVLVPAKDEAENLPLFMEQAAAAFANAPHRYEVIVIDDGSTDGTPAVLATLMERYSFLRVARHRSQRGIADALRTGFLHAAGNVLVFYPADLQFKPEDIPRLVAPVLADEADMVTGFKQGEYDKQFVSGIYNGLSRWLFNVKVKDLNSVKAYRREIMEGLPARPDWHRYMIVIAAAQGYTVTEIMVPLYPRHAGKSKFATWRRIPIGVLDMLSVWFELRFAKKPLLLFGMLGAGIFAFATIAGLIVGASALLGMRTLAVRSVWSLITTCLILGSIFFATGILGEQVAGQRAEMRELRRQLDELRALRDQATPR
jgi:glycosyltransferase involved in cell wall biosynthesis